MRPLKFHSKYLNKTYYIQPDVYNRAIKLNHSLVKYCKSNGEYHVESDDMRMVHLGNLDTRV